MKIQKKFKYFLLIVSLHLATTSSFSQIKTYCFKATVYSISGASYINGNIAIGDTVYGTIKYDLNLPDTEPIPELGVYVNSTTTSDIYAKIGNLICQTNTNNPTTYFEVQRHWYNNPDQISYFNRDLSVDIPISSSLDFKRWLTFAIDDPSQTVLPNTNIPSYINLNSWASKFFSFSAEQRNEQNIVVASAGVVATVVSLDTICSQVAGVKNFGINNNNLKIFPNPSNGQFTIETNFSEQQVVQIFDLNGRLILNQNINKTTLIDGSFLNNGVYVLTIKNDKDFLTQKLVISK